MNQGTFVETGKPRNYSIIRTRLTGELRKVSLNFKKGDGEMNQHNIQYFCLTAVGRAELQQDEARKYLCQPGPPSNSAGRLR